MRIRPARLRFASRIYSLKHDFDNGRLPAFGGFFMNRNMLYALVGALVVATAVLGYKVYQDNKEPQGLQINLGPGGVKIQNK